eukprot:TRINITY_DN88900_c0_g1_i1.p1 TRINITY_DN88900_c0_g1~~TRINITY_DN88900_c0_g1_i1.p1  ORF type:complete len:1243 (-),score=126.99 TRINITY_DN88900_c0_g1_i1:171-3776(-)
MGPVPPVEGIIPTQMVFRTTPTTDINSNDVIEIGATYPIWAAVGGVTCTITVDGQASTTLFSSTRAEDLSRFVATVANPYKTAAAGEEIIFTCTDNFAPHATVGTNVRFYFQSSNDRTLVFTTGWTTVLGRLDSPAVAITPAVAVEYTIPTRLVFSARTTNPLVAWNTLTITSDTANIWTGVGDIYCDVTVSGAANSVIFTTESTDLKTLVALVGVGQTIAANTPIVFTCSENITEHAVAGTSVNFAFQSTADPIPVAGIFGWVTIATQLTSCSVALTPTNYVELTPPTQIVFSATVTTRLLAYHSITIASDVPPIWAAATGMSCSVTIGGTPDSTIFRTAASDLKTFVATVQDSQTVDGGQTIVFTCTENLANLAVVGTSVSFTFVSTSDTIPLAGVTGWQTVATSMTNCEASLPNPPFIAGIVPENVTFKTTITTPLRFGTIRFASITSQIWSAVRPVTCQITIDGTINTTAFASTATSDRFTFVATLQTGYILPAATQLVFTCTDNLEPLPPAGTTEQFQFQSTSDTVIVPVTGWGSVLAQLKACSVGLTPMTYIAGTTPTQIVFSLTTTTAIPSANTVTIKASHPIWAAVAFINCAVTVNGVADTAVFGTGAASLLGTRSTDASTFVATVQYARLVPIDSAVVFTCNSNLDVHHPPGTNVTFSFESSTDETPAEGVLGWVTTATSMASPSVSISPITAVEYTTPVQVVFSATTNRALGAAATITITASTPIWAAPAFVTCSITLGGSADTTTFASTSATDTRTLVATVAAGQSIGTGVAIVWTCTNNLRALEPAGNPVTFTFESSQDEAPVTGVTGWTTALPQMTSCSVALAPITHYQYTVPTSITFGASTANKLPAGGQITITASHVVWNVTAATPVTCTVTVDGSANTATFGSLTSATDQYTFVATVQAFRFVGAGSAVTFTCTDNFLELGPAYRTVSFTFQSTADTTPLTGVVGWTSQFPPTTPGSVSGDPVTWYGDHRAEFKLPLGQLTTMLETPDVIVAAAPFEGAKKEQWIGRVVVMLPETGEVFTQVDIKRDLLDFERSSEPEELETMTTLVSPNSVRGTPPFDAQFTHPGGLIMQYGKHKCQKELCQEFAVIMSKSAKISIQSASAVEYYGEGADALVHAHLDLMVFDMIDSHRFGGLLPEMWGIKPMTNETAALLVIPEASADSELMLAESDTHRQDACTDENLSAVL